MTTDEAGLTSISVSEQAAVTPKPRKRSLSAVSSEDETPKAAKQAKSDRAPSSSGVVKDPRECLGALADYIKDLGKSDVDWSRWSCQVKVRKTGVSSGSSDAYFISADGKKHRSRKDVARYLGLGASAASGTKSKISTTTATTATIKTPKTTKPPQTPKTLPANDKRLSVASGGTIDQPPKVPNRLKRPSVASGTSSKVPTADKEELIEKRRSSASAGTADTQTVKERPAAQLPASMHPDRISATGSASKGPESSVERAMGPPPAVSKAPRVSIGTSDPKPLQSKERSAAPTPRGDHAPPYYTPRFSSTGSVPKQVQKKAEEPAAAPITTQAAAPPAAATTAPAAQTAAAQPPSAAGAALTAAPVAAPEAKAAPPAESAPAAKAAPAVAPTPASKAAPEAKAAPPAKSAPAAEAPAAIPAPATALVPVAAPSTATDRAPAATAAPAAPPAAPAAASKPAAPVRAVAAVLPSEHGSAAAATTSLIAALESRKLSDTPPGGARRSRDELAQAAKELADSVKVELPLQLPHGVVLHRIGQPVSTPGFHRGSHVFPPGMLASWQPPTKSVTIFTSISTQHAAGPTSGASSTPAAAPAARHAWPSCTFTVVRGAVDAPTIGTLKERFGEQAVELVTSISPNAALKRLETFLRVADKLSRMDITDLRAKANQNTVAGKVIQNDLLRKTLQELPMPPVRWPRLLFGLSHPAVLAKLEGCEAVKHCSDYVYAENRRGWLHEQRLMQSDLHLYESKAFKDGHITHEALTPGNPNQLVARPAAPTAAAPPRRA